MIQLRVGVNGHIMRESVEHDKRSDVCTFQSPRFNNSVICRSLDNSHV